MVPRTPETYPHPDEAWYQQQQGTSYVSPQSAPEQHPQYNDGADGTRGVESTLDKLLHAKHKVLHPASHAKHKLKHSAVGKPVRVVKKIGRLFGGH